MPRRVGRPAREVSRVGLSTEPFTETLVVSDLHLGLKTARPRAVLETLERWRFARLVLLGDILHDGGFENLCNEAWRLLRRLRAIARDGDAELVWLAGNHDRHLAPAIRDLVGVEVGESYAWRSGGRRLVAVHGDDFDPTLPRRPSVARLIGLGYGWAMRRLSRDGDWPRRLDRWWSKRCGLHAFVAAGAAAWAGRHDADLVLCGHTHAPLARRFENVRPDRAPVTYVNAGSWVERRPSFLAVDPDGIRLIHAH
ncbi:MAG: metallophosphoesterase family protein [Geminicoccaceae bacterium]|nr:metallophosphoesterase family protein [Geminicoccaceae bacterium]MDW8370238.1 metallophosphoesterase family protein [Geminicoccaceae bacterium]